MSIWGKRVDGWVNTHRPASRMSERDMLGLALLVIVLLLLGLFVDLS
jgi:hypothetical protein